MAREEIVGSSSRNLVFKTAGSIRVLVGDKYYDFNFSSNGSSNKEDESEDRILVVDDIESYLIGEIDYPGDKIIIFTMDGSIYVTNDGEYIPYVEGDGSSGDSNTFIDTVSFINKIPFSVSSNSLIKNLNANYLNGLDSNHFVQRNGDADLTRISFDTIRSNDGKFRFFNGELYYDGLFKLSNRNLINKEYEIRFSYEKPNDDNPIKTPYKLNLRSELDNITIDGIKASDKKFGLVTEDGYPNYDSDLWLHDSLKDLRNKFYYDASFDNKSVFRFTGDIVNDLYLGKIIEGEYSYSNENEEFIKSKFQGYVCELSGSYALISTNLVWDDKYSIIFSDLYNENNRRIIGDISNDLFVGEGVVSNGIILNGGCYLSSPEIHLPYIYKELNGNFYLFVRPGDNNYSIVNTGEIKVMCDSSSMNGTRLNIYTKDDIVLKCGNNSFSLTAGSYNQFIYMPVSKDEYN